MVRKVEKYEVESEIGHGGMATVFRARDTKLDRLVALKIMHPHLRGAAEARARFRREAQSVARLKHDRVLEIYDYSGEDSDESYIAAELLTGPTLRKWSDDHAPVPSEVAACFAIEVCRALAAAHEKGIVHRDVKPENILLHENRELKLTDFGIADMVDSQSMTATGQILGSPGHMAPEQIEGGHADRRTDLFALGTVLYLLCTGRLPFTGKNPHQVLKRVVDGDYADPERFAPALGAGMAAVIKKALEKRPEDRYASAEEMEAALTALTRELAMGDAHDEVAKFLAAPAERTKEITQKIVERSLARGREAKQAGRIAEAQACLGRVLALDEGNAEALALLSHIGSARERAESGRRFAIGGAVILGALVLAVGVSRFFVGDGDASTGSPDAGGVALVLADAHDASAEASVGTARAEDDAALDATDGGSETDADFDAGTEESAVAWLPPITRRTPTSTTPRHVVFHNTLTENYRISIDGGPPLTSARAGAVDLAPGRHQFHFSSTLSAFGELDLTREIEPGPGTTTIEVALPPAPASLRVDANVRGVVIISGLPPQRTHDLITVPMTGVEDPVHDTRVITLSVVPDDHSYETYNGQVTLTAGALRALEVTVGQRTTDAP
ncbi:MAG: serine/threonine-protein kinase [Sandaracinus sp.]